MPRMSRKLAFLLALTGILLLSISGSAYAQGLKTLSGTLPDGATFLIEVPANWNGTLFLYSHGYVVPGSPNPARDVGDPLTRLFLLSNGFALAGSSYATTGYAIHEALPDQIAVLDLFNSAVGHPTRTIAWGHSLGGIITAGLIQRFPERFTAALPMCGVLAGSVATWNLALNGAFAFKTLVGPGSGLQIVHITNPNANLALAEQLLAIAQTTPQGRARIALGAALGDVPGWFVTGSPEPSDPASQEANQFLWSQQVDFPFAFALRAELEARAHGNPSWNAGVDYEEQLEHSRSRDEVKALYEQAGLSLDADLDTLNNAARVEADPNSVEYLEENIIFNGDIDIPVLTLHTTGDGLVVVENESAYKKIVREEDNGRLLRETFVHRAGHCTFTPAETIAAVQKLLSRLDTGRWGEVEAEDLNQAAAALGPVFNIAPPAFFEFKPGRYLRPFDAEAEEHKRREHDGDDGDHDGDRRHDDDK